MDSINQLSNEEVVEKFKDWSSPQVKRLYCFVDSGIYQQFKVKAIADGFTLQEALSLLIEAFVEGQIVKVDK